MIPRTHPHRQTSPRQHRTEAPRLNARLLAITGPTHQQAVGVLLLGEPDHASQNLLGQYQQDAEERGLGFAAVVCPDTEGGRQQSLVPMLRDHLSNQTLFIILDPRRDGAASAAEDEALGLANLLKANGFEINMASAALVNVHDPMADMAVSDIQLMAHTYRLLQEDDNPEARMVLNLLDDPSEGSMDCRFTLMGAALHYQSHGMEPLLPMWYRIGTEASPADSEDSDADAGAGTIASALAGWVDLDDAALQSTAWQAIEQREDGAALLDLVVRLGELFPSRDQPAIRQLLDRLARTLCADPAFADTALAICNDATSSCSDRVTLVLNQLDCALRARDVARGKHDHQLPTVIEVARQVFRRNQLDRMAREKVRLLQRAAAVRDEGGEHAEALETHLAYLHELHHALELGGAPPDAKYTAASLSGVSDEDLELAMQATKAAENGQFPHALADWTPWQQVLARLDPDGVARLKEELADPDFWAGVDTEVRALAIAAGTPADALGVTVSIHRNRRALEITSERWMALTLALLDRNGQRELIEPYWR
jgi:hypothetical protein